MTDEQRQQMQEAAHQYLDRGWSVIPVGRDKRPLLGSWKQYQTTHATHEQIEQWFKQWPQMNIGIVTGAISGIAVVDVEAGGSTEGFPPTSAARTGGGGWHLYYKHPGGEVKNATRITELTDIRGDGGFVVAPPSESDKGSYSWALAPEDNEMAEYPADLIASFRKEPVAKMDSLTNGKAPIGQRNDTATRFIGSVFAKLPTSMWPVAAWGALKEWNAVHTEQPLEERELRSVYESIKRRAELTRDDTVDDVNDPVTLEPMTLRQLYKEEFPPVLWLAEDLIPLGGVTALTGDSNSFKSFLTMVLAMSVVQGKPFLNHFNTTKGKVLVVDEENHRRFIRKRFEEMGMDATDDILFLSLKGIKLDRDNYTAALKDVLDKEQPSLVILDSLVRFHSKEENSATEMARVMNEIKKLTGDDRAVVVVHHHKKERTPGRGGLNVRGSSDIFAALDCHIAVERNEDNSLLLSQNKLRIQRQLDPFRVATVMTEGGLEFVYDGTDTSKKEEVWKVAGEIKATLEVSPEALSKKALLQEIDTTRGILNQALKLLLNADEITADTRAHGAHYYEIAPSDEDEQEDDESDIAAQKRAEHEAEKEAEREEEKQDESVEEQKRVEFEEEKQAEVEKEKEIESSQIAF